MDMDYLDWTLDIQICSIFVDGRDYKIRLPSYAIGVQL